MGVFSRFFKVTEAGANRLIDKMEKPELMLDQAIRDREKSIGEARQKVQSVIATERQTKAIIEKEEIEAQRWEERAQKALAAGEEDLAAQALTRSEEHHRKAESLRPNWQLQRKSVDHLKVDLRRMDDELAELKRNKDIIIAQSKTAEVKKSIYEAKASIGRNSSDDLIARMKAKAERASYEAEAAQELSSDTGGESLENKFKKIDNSGQSEAVKQRLEAMKKQIGK